MSGKVVPDPTRDDLAAVSRFGVNSATHKDLIATGFFREHNFSRENALAAAEMVFRIEYFLHLSGDQIADQVIANKYCDLAFNEGIAQATKLVQRAVNDCGRIPELADDGKPGAMTIAAINACDETELLAAIRAQATKFYTNLAEARPEFKDELKGWLARVND